MGRKWTAEEDAILTRVWNETTSIKAVCEALPHRTRGAIYRRKAKLPALVKKLVYGVGVNDLGVSDHFPDKRKAKIYITWRNMLKRGYSAKYKRRRPTYIGVSVSSRWHTFSNFVTWMEVNFPWDRWRAGERWELDKDILVPGNKVYSPEACCFIPQRVNVLFTHKRSTNTSGVPGVSWDSLMKTWRAQIYNGSHDRYLGCYPSLSEAKLAYYTAKQKIVEEVIGEYEGILEQRILDALYRYLENEFIPEDVRRDAQKLCA